LYVIIRHRITPFLCPVGWTYPLSFCPGDGLFFPEQLANASDFALSTLAIIAFPGKIRNEGGRKKYISTEMSENKG
jgi:hypothetical protein